MATKKSSKTTSTENKPVYAIAKDNGLQSKELIAKIAEWDLGWTVTSHANRLTPEQQEQVAAKLKPAKKAPAKKKATAKKTTAKKTTAKKAPAKKAAAEKAPAKRTRTKKAKAEEAPAVEAVATEEAPKRKRTRTKKAKAEDTPAVEAAAAEEKPKKSRSRSRKPKTEEAVEAAATEEKPETPPVDGAAETKKYLKSVFKAMGVRLPRLEAEEDNDRVYVNLNGFGNESIIGSMNAAARTDIIEALQTLAGKAVYPSGPSKMIVLDIGGFRKAREQSLAAAAARVAEYVRKSGKSLRFAVMNSFDRRAFHMNLRSEKDVWSESEGHGVFRRLRVKPKS